MRSTRPKPGSPSTPPPGGFHRSPVVLEDLLAGLLWPRLLQTWRLALNPGRMLLCLFLLVAVMTMDTLYAKIAGEPVGPIVTLISDCHRDLHRIHDTPRNAFQHIYHLFVFIPRDFVHYHWPALLTIVPLTVVLWSIVGGAVCRSAACEVSVRATMPWRATLGFGIRKAPAFIASFAGPLILIWLIAGGAWACGLLFSFKVTGVLAALGFGFFLLAGFIFTVLTMGFLVGHFMLIPALACEGTDSFDAVQRTYAYVIARPGRLTIYALILLGTVLLAVALAFVMTTTSVHFALTAGGAPMTLGDLINGDFVPDKELAYGATYFILRVWLLIAAALFGSYILSLYFCSSTTMYLIMRRLVDGQDIAELWMPAAPVEAPTTAAPAATPPAAAPPDKADYT